jgi:NADH:ubiquinone oxidoreductase subunit 4 (subunit M)
MHSRNIADYGGVVNTMPKFAALMMLFAMANCGLPATSGFVGEFMVIVGAMKFISGSRFLPERRSSSAPPTRCGCTSA